MALERFGLDRRRFVALAGGALTAGAAGIWPNISLASNNTGVPLHGLSAFGDLKYSKDYKHFEYVNPNAPKGRYV